MKVTVLGCGSAGGVPTALGEWGQCDPLNPKNYRTRSSVLVEDEGTTILIDFGPDLRQQLLNVNFTGKIDAAILTHVHADHSHGVDDLRRMFWKNGRVPLPVFCTMQTRDMLVSRFPYAFEPFAYGEQTRPALSCFPLYSHMTCDVNHLKIASFVQDHVTMPTAGIRIGDFAYSIDVKRLGRTALERLTDLKVWIVDCQQWDEHSSHAHFAQTMEWIRELKPERTYLSHMGSDLDYEALKAQCPEGVEPAYDGLVITI